MRAKTRPARPVFMALLLAVVAGSLGACADRGGIPANQPPAAYPAYAPRYPT